MAGVGSHRHFYERVTNDVLGRSAIGCFPRMPEPGALEAGHGVRLMNSRIVSPTVHPHHRSRP